MLVIAKVAVANLVSATLAVAKRVGGALQVMGSSLSRSIVPETGTLNSFTHVTSHVIKDHEGLWRETAPGSASFWGGREVENKLIFPEDFSNAAWIADGVTKVGTTTIDGFFAMEISFGVATSNLYQDYAPENAGEDIIPAFKVRAVSGSTTVRVRVGPATSANITIDDTKWWWIAGDLYTTPDLIARRIGIRNNSTGNATNIYLAAAQLEDFTGESVQVPNSYISRDVLSFPFHGAGVDGVKWFSTTNGNTVTNNVVIEAVGAALTTDKGFVSDSGSTNLVLRSEDFSLTWNNSWSGGVTLEDNSTLSPDGKVTADKLTQIDSETDAISQTITLDPSTTYNVSFFCKNLDSTRSKFLIFDTNAGSPKAFLHFDWSGLVPSTQSSSGVSDIKYESIVNDWWRISFSFTTASVVTTHIITVTPESGVIATNSMYAWGAQINPGTFPGLYTPTNSTYITTTPTTLKYAWPTGLVNDMVFELNVTPLAANQGQVTIVSGYTDANNWFEIGHDGTNIYARKRIAGVNYDAVKALAYVEDTTYNVKARISSAQAILEAQGVDIWVDNVIGTNHANTTNIAEPGSFAIGSMDGAINMLAAIELVDVHSGSMTDAEVVAL